MSGNWWSFRLRSGRLRDREGLGRALLGLMRDDLSFDLQVGGLRDYFFGIQIGFGTIGAAADDLLRERWANTGQRIKLINGCAIDIDEAVG